MNKQPLSTCLEIHKNGIDPLLHPHETFYYYTLPDFDEGKTVNVTQGKSIGSNKFIVKTGSILISKLNPRIKRVWLVWNDEKMRSVCSTEFVVVVPKANVDTSYLFYICQSEEVYRELECDAVGTTNSHVRYKPNALYGIKANFPKKPIQEKIASILQTIDQSIEKTEALIEKYQQIKAGLMHDLFTRGIGPDGKLRPPREQAPELYQETSIGWIPKEWSCGVVADCGSVKLGRQRSPDQHSGKWTMPYLRVANVYDGFFELEDVLTMDFTPNERNVFSVKRGDILLNEGQSLELVGRCALYLEEDDKYCFQNTLIRFRCNDGHDPFFYRQLFKYYLDIGKFMEIASQTTSVAHLGADRFARLYCPLISPAEQKLIAEKLGLIDSRISTEQSLMHKYKRQKSGLMHDLLTGKVEVKAD